MARSELVGWRIAQAQDGQGGNAPTPGVERQPAKPPRGASGSTLSKPPGPVTIADSYGDPLTLGAFALVAILAVAFLVACSKWWMLRRSMIQHEREIASALRMPQTALADAAHHINQLMRAAMDLQKDNLRLEKASSAAGNPQPAIVESPDQKMAKLVIACLDIALQSADALQSDPDFQAVDQSLGLQAGLRSAAEALRTFPHESNSGAQLTAILEGGDLNTALTASAFIDAYYSDRREWRRHRTALRAVDAVLVMLLNMRGVQVVQTPILQVVGAEEIRNAQVSDRRNVRRLPHVQRQAARAARDLRSEEFLIVDCHSPGWIFDQHKRLPSIAVFDPSSWT
jgi:hypothetical protein